MEQNRVKTKIEISVVVPLYNEERNLRVFFTELKNALVEYGKPFEIIFVNDGSTDNSQDVLLNIAKQNRNIKIISLRKNAGKARALEQGFKLTNGEKVAILDSDLQYDPRDLATLADHIDKGCDVVSGKRVSRADSRDVVLTSRIFRMIVKKLSGLNFEDYFSGIKIFKSSVLDYLEAYGDLNRIFTVYAFRAGYKIIEVPVRHRPREHGSSKYNFLDRLKLAIQDLIVLFYIVTIKKEKLYRIGLLGIFILNCGVIITVASIFLVSNFTSEEILGNGVTHAGVFFIYLGWQLRIIEIVGREFMERHEKGIGRHERESAFNHDLRSRNVKEVDESLPQ